MSRERDRLRETREKGVAWKRWGPYLSERQWGTVREDYSDDGNAWDYFPHDHARSRAYRWGEDGLAGFSDDRQLLCFALALWNGADPILKERLFGLTNGEGNHGEDVKEYYFYLDATPTHSYQRYLYKYPQSAFPYDDLVLTNARRARTQYEYELLDTGVFDQDRYFDVFVEYAKASPEDLLVRIRVHNRGPERATLHVLPQLWFRNTWSDGSPKPRLEAFASGERGACVLARHAQLGDRYLASGSECALLFTDNETNHARISGGRNDSEFVKDGIDESVVHGRRECVNPRMSGTKVAFDHELSVEAGEMAEIRLRLSPVAPGKSRSGEAALGTHFDEIFRARIAEADEFYAELTPSSCDADAARVIRQALAGMLWSKQYYFLDASTWLEEHGAHPLRSGSRPARNRDWAHMLNADVISMPDKWEYPWYAAWDLAFHVIALADVDPDFAKAQLALVLGRNYLHPSGQIPAYEWNFGDVNPPVQAWALLFLLRTLEAKGETIASDQLESAFLKLLLNFTWWVNRKDRTGRNVFEGGFLGLDNIGVFDRSAPLPTGGHLEQADGTAWMAMFCQNMTEIAVELAGHNRVYEPFVAKFVDHFLWIAAAMNRRGDEGMWDEEDGFYYDVLRLPDGSVKRLRVRSLVGLLPLCATTIIESEQVERVTEATAVIAARLREMPELLESIHPTDSEHLGVHGRRILALLRPERLRRVLARMLDPEEFLGPYGIRSISKAHEAEPYVFRWEGREYSVAYLPAESDTGVFGGNSNWRGPVWFPINVLLIRALLGFYLYYGDSFRIEFPTGSGREASLYEVASDLARRLSSIFLRDSTGRRPVYGHTRKFQEDPHWRDLVLFYEYFHGDDGAGLGASHQTGWTGIVARLMQLFASTDAERFLAEGRQAVFSPKPEVART